MAILVFGPPRLPPELERLIFELAAWNTHVCAARLIRVAHRVLVWIEPLLHRVYAIGDAMTYSRLRNLVLRRPAFAAENVRFLRFSSSFRDVFGVDTHYILRTCISVQVLSTTGLASHPALLEDLCEMRAVRRLSLHIGTAFAFAGTWQMEYPTYFPFAGLTHLTVEDPEITLQVVDVLQSGIFPNLTHIAFAGLASFPSHHTIREILAAPALRKTLVHMAVFVYFTHHRNKAASRLEQLVGDPRVDVAASYLLDAEWDAAARGNGPDEWEQAKERAQRRRKCELPACTPMSP
ncbi:hypothetical protein HMN09_00917000 [Mycena chlorophos]|uniref:Uncharacterized protein n=1 Tax=Mycena chlorophos TaxID=658473 RepID=A0A8H6SK51_MYCCL|nr:hypothetical protein HMN09_00917000 [Mycena chlorophos]